MSNFWPEPRMLNIWPAPLSADIQRGMIFSEQSKIWTSGRRSADIKRGEILLRCCANQQAWLKIFARKWSLALCSWCFNCISICILLSIFNNNNIFGGFQDWSHARLARWKIETTQLAIRTKVSFKLKRMKFWKFSKKVFWSKAFLNVVLKDWP